MAEVVNKSGVVITREGKRLYGFDAALYKKQQSKEDPEWDKKVHAWVEGVMEEKLPSDDLWTCLKNGTVLCRLVNKIKAGTVRRFNKTRLFPLMEMDNITLALEGMWKLGVPDEAMFAVQDLYKRNDMGKVYMALEELSKIALNFGIKVEVLDSKANRERPAMVSLVEEEKKEGDDALAEQIICLRKQINAVQAKLHTVTEDEETFQEKIKAMKREWRSEKTQLIYDVTNAEKRLKKRQNSSEPKDRRQKLSKAPALSRRSSQRLTELQGVEAFYENERRELLKTIEKEKEAITRAEQEVHHLKEDIGEEPPVKILAPQDTIVEEPSSYTAVTGAGEGYFFYQSELTSPQMLEHLSIQLQKLFIGEEVRFEDLTRLRDLLTTKEGKRAYCCILKQTLQVANTKHSALYKVSDHSFDLLLWLFTTVLAAMGDKADFFSARELYFGAKLIAREVGVGDKPRVECMQQFVRTQQLWGDVSFWEQLGFSRISSAFQAKFKGASVVSDAFSAKERTFIIKQIKLLVEEMRSEWKLGDRVCDKLVLRLSEQLNLDKSSQQKLLESVHEIVREDLSPRKKLSQLSLKSPRGGSNAGNSPKKSPRSPFNRKKSPRGSPSTSQVVPIVAHAPPPFPLFGVSVAKALMTEQRMMPSVKSQHGIPTFLEAMFVYLEFPAIHSTPGIFRQSGSNETAVTIRRALEHGEPVDWQQYDVHEVATLFKMWLMQLPEPLCTFEVYDLIPNIRELEGSARLVYLRELLGSIPKAQLAILRRLLSLMRKTAAREEVNKMSAYNLAVCFSPTLFRPVEESLTSLQNTENYVQCTQMMFENDLFDDEDEVI